MRRPFCLTLLLCAFATAALAQTPAPSPPAPTPKAVWAHGDDEFILSVAARRNADTQHVDFNLTGAWGHYATDATEIGIATSVFRTGGDGGAGVGPFYQWNLPALGSGNFFLGGELLGLTSQAADNAAAAARAEIGYKAHIGRDAAARISLNFQKPALLKSGAPDPNALDQVAVIVGFSVAGKAPGR